MSETCSIPVCLPELGGGEGGETLLGKTARFSFMQILKNGIAAMKLPAVMEKRIQRFSILNATEIQPHGSGGFWHQCIMVIRNLKNKLS